MLIEDSIGREIKSRLAARCFHGGPGYLTGNGRRHGVEQRQVCLSSKNHDYSKYINEYNKIHQEYYDDLHSGKNNINYGNYKAF